MKRFWQHPLVRLVAGFVWVFALYIAGGGALIGVPTTLPWLNLLAVTAASALGLAGYYGFVRVWERRKPVAELALRPAAWELAQGLLWGAGLFTLAFGLLVVFGYYRVTGSNGWAGVPIFLSLSILSGVMEELIFRAVVYRLVQEWLGTWIALLISALLFGAVHLTNPNASLVAGLAIAIEAGLLLALAYQVTGRVWVPIGLHLAWNFTQGGIFGVAISGTTIPAQGLLSSVAQGPEWLTGGAFGVEASLFAVLVCLGGAAFFLWQMVRGGRVVAAPWQRRKAAAAAPVP